MAAGAGDGTAPVSGPKENHFFLAGDAEAAGDAAVAASFFLECFVLAGAGDALVSAVAVAAGEAAFLACLCLAGEAEAAGLALGDGDCAIKPTVQNTVTATIKRVSVFIAGGYGRMRYDCNVKDRPVRQSDRPFLDRRKKANTPCVLPEAAAGRILIG